MVPNSPPAVPRLVPRHADQEHDRREHVADQPLEAEVGNADQIAEPAEQPVGERDQRDEREHHRADRDRELDAGLRALRGGHDDVGRLLAFLERLGDLDLRVLDRVGVRADRRA